MAAFGCNGANEDATSSRASDSVSSGASAPTSIAVITADPAPAASVPTTTPAPTTEQLTPAEMILHEMTLREKAAQVLLLAFDGTTLLPATERLLAETPPAGLLLLSWNVVEAEQLAALTAALQDAATAGGSKVRLFIAADQEGGPVQRIRSGAPIIPAARVLGEAYSLEEARRLAQETAGCLLELGVNMNLAPVADVVSDPDSFLYRRTYGGDPTLVSDFVEAVAGASLRAGLIPVVKHFPGHGSASGDTHGEVVISEATQTEFATNHLLPFKAAFAAGVECVMVAHIVVTTYDPDRPASLSSAVVEGLLRDGLGFSGLVVADDLEMAAAAGTNPGGNSSGGSDIGELAVSALEAGCDLLISTGTLQRQQMMMDAIVEAVESGRLTKERLDEAVLRMLETKLRHGLTAP
jgi:beta-N-acetylhexosaminidase